MKKTVLVIGGGLAGCECAFTLAKYGIQVILFEQKPQHYSPAHTSQKLGELVCSNSFRSDKAEGPHSSGVGILKREMRRLDSTLLACADMCQVPAGKALAVDRDLFAEKVTESIEKDPLIQVEHYQVKSLDEANQLKEKYQADYIVLASGPLTSESLALSLQEYIGSSHFYFYDAIAPIVHADSLDNSIVFRGSRYDNVPPPPYNDEVANSAELSEFWRNKMAEEVAEAKAKQEETSGKASSENASERDKKNNGQDDEIGQEADGDYLNCPMHKHEYYAFYQALLDAEKIASKDFEKEVHFEGCMPIEALAERGERTLTFGPLKPVGFTDPRTGRRPYALLQLRLENNNGDAYNLVGCQTKMSYKAQDSVFRLVPGLENVEFLRHGSMHRNTYVNAPICLNSNLSLKNHEHIFLAGQITGVEGYVESAACGLWLGLYLAALLNDKNLEKPSQTTALGALLYHLENGNVKNFQPSNCHFGLMPAFEEKIHKKNRKAMMAERAFEDFELWYSNAKM